MGGDKNHHPYDKKCKSYSMLAHELTPRAVSAAMAACTTALSIFAHMALFDSVIILKI